MFKISVYTDKMAAEGKNGGYSIAKGTKKYMQEMMDMFSKHPDTIYCKIIRVKDGEVVAEYHRDAA